MLSVLYEGGVRLKLPQCFFVDYGVSVLGCRVKSGCLLPSTAHVESIKALEEPGFGVDLMRFLELAIYFSQFVDYFAEHASPVYDVLKKTGFQECKDTGKGL